MKTKKIQSTEIIDILDTTLVYFDHKLSIEETYKIDQKSFCSIIAFCFLELIFYPFILLFVFKIIK